MTSRSPSEVLKRSWRPAGRTWEKPWICLMRRRSSSPRTSYCWRRPDGRRMNPKLLYPTPKQDWRRFGPTERSYMNRPSCCRGKSSQASPSWSPDGRHCPRPKKGRRRFRGLWMSRWSVKPRRSDGPNFLKSSWMVFLLPWTSCDESCLYDDCLLVVIRTETQRRRDHDLEQIQLLRAEGDKVRAAADLVL